MVIKCPNCNHYVSDTAEQCPKCGYKLKNNVVKDDSSSFDELSSYLHSIEESEGCYSFLLDNGVCICCNHEDFDSEVQFFIEEFKKQTSDKHFFDARDAYLKFKQSEYFSDFSIKGDECNEGYVHINCTSKTDSPSPYIAKMLISVYGVTSPDQIEIVDFGGDKLSEEDYSDASEDYSESFEEDSEDSAETWMNILCFLIPIVGLILYFVKKNEYPNTAKSYLTWAAVGFGVALLLNRFL